MDITKKVPTVSVGTKASAYHLRNKNPLKNKIFKKYYNLFDLKEFQQYIKTLYSLTVDKAWNIVKSVLVSLMPQCSTKIRSIRNAFHFNN